MPKEFDGKVALVTGGSSGIGRAASLAYAGRGAKVVVADVDVQGGEETLQMVKEAGGEASMVHADVSNASEVQAMLNRTVELYGRLDFAFNNAGVAGRDISSTADYSEDDWDRVIGVDLKGVWLCMKAEIPQMLRQGGGAIVNTASVAGLVGIRGTCAYIAAKHGVAGLTKAAALEYGSSGIRVNAVAPGYIRTPLFEAILDQVPGYEEQVVDRHPLGRIGTAEEIADAVVWLSSEASSFVTGHTMAVDGGYLAQ